MKPGDFPRHAARFLEVAREVGFKEALRRAGLRMLLDPTDLVPLARVNTAGLFATDVDRIHEQERQQIRATSLMFDASQVESSYPLVFEWEDRFLRYAFLPAEGESRGLVVLFHGHNAFLHFGPVRRWRHFDVLAPWDTFGWRRQGSWFWGEKGNNSVEIMIQALIAQYRDKAPASPWFCTGGSMGGFGALYHGIKYACDGIYVMCPQIDMTAKIVDYGADNPDNPYRYLKGDGPEALPDILRLAEEHAQLPPLYLIQNQYDHVNPFPTHALRLVQTYNRKGAWCGLRVHPSVGHGGDGKQEEAELFFTLILDHAPAGRATAGTSP